MWGNTERGSGSPRERERQGDGWREVRGALCRSHRGKFQKELDGQRVRAGLGWTDFLCATNVAQQPGSDPGPPGEKD